MSNHPDATANSAVRGSELRDAFLSAAGLLEDYRETVNALNVFPVPDGDTGTNMLLTIRSATASLPEQADPTASEVAKAMAQGAFFGARGNSGVILSQFFQGFSDALQESPAVAAEDIARAFELATDAAYGSVGKPVEGTMLTVVRRAAEAVREEVDKPDSSPVASLWEVAVEASLDALKHTPDQLPVLKRAGVVDSGGLGLVVILGGALNSLAPGSGPLDLTGVAGLDQASAGAGGSLADEGYLESTLETGWGYCTEFIIQGEELDLAAVRGRFQEIALSTVVVGGGRHVRVHVHVEDPGPALSYGVSLGSLSNVKIENMDQQNMNFAGHGSAAPGPAAEMAVVAVVSGGGLGDLFRDAGCAVVVEGGQTMNPSVAQILEGAKQARANHVIVLPNNKNIVASAQQAAANDPSLHVVSSATVPQGVAALFAYNPERPLEDNLRSMEDALSTVASISVTRAVRDAAIDGISVNTGKFIGLLEGELKATADSAEAVLRSTLAAAGLTDDSIVTLYLGADSDAGAAEAFAKSLAEDFPGIQIDQVDGGQLHYHYLASVE